MSIFSINVPTSHETRNLARRLRKSTTRSHAIRSRRPLLDPDALLIDLGLDEPCQISQRLLPTEITSLRWNDVRHACLRNINLGADRYFLQRHSHLHLAGQVGIVEFVRVTQAFVRNELDIFASKCVAFARCEVPEGHFERATDLWFQMM